jgi:hypothetical protein
MESYFVDARLAGQAIYPLNETPGPTQGQAAVFPVPPESTQLITLAETMNPTVPFNLEMGYNNGTPPYFFLDSPDLLGVPFVDPANGNYASFASYSSDEVPPGFWFATTEELGPFGNSGAPASNVDIVSEVKTQPFDDTVSSDTGDLWANVFGSPAPYTPLMLGPRHVGTITVTITPSGAKGTVVRGFLYVDTVQLASGFLTTGTGDELIKIPYTYKIG